MAFAFSAGLNTEKVAALIHKLNSDPQFVLAQNVGTTHDLLDICLKRATVQGAQHVFQHVVPQEGKPVTNQKSSGEVFNFLPSLLAAAYFVVLKMALREQLCNTLKILVTNQRRGTGEGRPKNVAC